MLKGKILIADDEREFVDNLVEIIGSDAYLSNIEVDKAYDGYEAMEKLIKDDFDLVIMDIRMPKINGLEVMSIVKRLKPETMIFIMTGYGSEEIIRENIGKGGVKFYEKPVDINKLLEDIRDLFSSRVKGYIEGLGVVDFLQVVELSKRSCTLRVVIDNGESGVIFIEKGKIKGAIAGDKEGKEALRLIVGWEHTYPNVSIFVDPLTDLKDVVNNIEEAPISTLLLELAHEIDEYKKNSNKARSNSAYYKGKEENGNANREICDSDDSGLKERENNFKDKSVDKKTLVDRELKKLGIGNWLFATDEKVISVWPERKILVVEKFAVFLLDFLKQTKNFFDDQFQEIKIEFLSKGNEVLIVSLGDNSVVVLVLKDEKVFCKEKAVSVVRKLVDQF